MKNLRRTSQILIFILFVYLFIQTEYKGRNELGLPVRLFLDFDPLVALSALLASHAARSIFLLSLITVALTIFLGRFFCGWVCPLGTIHTALGALRMRGLKPNHPEGRYPKLRPLKYYILVFIIVAALFGWNAAGYLDPISLAIRSLAIGYNPAINKIARSVLDAGVALHVPVLSPAMDALYTKMTGTVLAFEQPVFRQTLFIGLIFTAILALNALAPRFWCRYLCPLGALLGLIGRKQCAARVENDKDKCISCGKCVVSCQGDATPFPPGEWAGAECLVCYNCREVCPADAISIRATTRKTGDGNVDLGRRRLLASGVAALLIAPALGTVVQRKRTSPLLIRPPGALPEQEFLSRCVKCGECMKVCLTNGLHPTLAEAGFEGLWTPILVPRLGYCEYNCNLCSQVCPTGAIRPVSVAEKQKIHIGLAFVDKNRCLPYAFGRNCIVCEEHCPTPEKAITFVEERAIGENGESIMLKKPVVNPDLCIGCGICETKCPVVDRPAIYVTAVNESRSEENQLFLSI
ncbi:MAG: 4Fe-4S binding protein [Candidatus Krumholzibacteria bacterium]|nr:4Fe-4S binding protein [Candidatus Krumholzibacteria bacterium]